MKVYMIDEDGFAKLERVLTDLYGRGEVLTADARRDLAHRLELIRNELRSNCEEGGTK